MRSIQLVLRKGVRLETIRCVAADAASRSSAAYVRVLLKAFHGNEPEFSEQPADLDAMLSSHDAALLIGDPALLALQQRETEGHCSDCTWVDVARLWRTHTGLPWVAAVWAVRPEALDRCGITRDELIADLLASRDAGMQHTDDLVAEWLPRIPLPTTVIRDYLTKNIHYTLDDACLKAIDRFFELAEDNGVLPPYRLRLL